MSSSNYINLHLLSKIIISTTILFGITIARTSSIDIDENSKESFSSSSSSLRLEQCHEGCLKKFSRDDRDCTQEADCFSCLDECNSYSKLPNKEIHETWGVAVTSLIRENSLVSASISWEPSTVPSDCLVTWEVSGGGLIGNLLTQSATVELSLWPETKYRIQVTCKNRVTENVSRSIPITLDTSEAITKNSPTSATVASQDLFSIFPTSTTSDFSALYANNKELILGFSAATFVFLCLLIALLIVSRRQSRPADKVPLVDEEVGVNVDVERLTIHV